MELETKEPKRIELIERHAKWILPLIILIMVIIQVIINAKSGLEYNPRVGTIVTRGINTSYQLNAYRDNMVSYSIQITSNLSISGGQSGTINLQTSPNNSTWTTVATQTNNNTGTLVIGLNTSSVQTASLTAFVPAGYYMRLQTSGTSAFLWISGMEVAL